MIASMTLLNRRAHERVEPIAAGVVGDLGVRAKRIGAQRLRLWVNAGPRSRLAKLTTMSITLDE